MSNLNGHTISIRGGSYFNYANPRGDFEWFHISLRGNFVISLGTEYTYTRFSMCGKHSDEVVGFRPSQRGWLRVGK